MNDGLLGRLLTVAALVLLAAAVVLGWQAGDAPLMPPPSADRAPWSLPPRPHSDAAAAMAALEARRPWGEVTSPAQAAAAAGAAGGAGQPNAAAASSAWRLAGIVERGQDHFALIASGVGPGLHLAYLRVGDRLPDGSVLLRIATDSATIANAKASAQPRIYRLFGEKP
jgi:hypothetical protein